MNRVHGWGAALALLAGCAAPGPEPSPAPAARPEPVAQQPVAPRPAAPAAPVAKPAPPPVAPDPAPPAPEPAASQRPVEARVHFDINSEAITPAARAVLERLGRELAGNRAMRLVIEGHGDDRGSRELNLALGKRRAEAVRRLLLTLGAVGPQLDVVSYGSEKPLVSGTGEQAWAQNRRVDIVQRRLR